MTVGLIFVFNGLSQLRTERPKQTTTRSLMPGGVPDYCGLGLIRAVSYKKITHELSFARDY